MRSIICRLERNVSPDVRSMRRSRPRQQPWRLKSVTCSGRHAVVSLTCRVRSRKGELETREHVVKKHQDQIRQARSGPARGLSQQRINPRMQHQHTCSAMSYEPRLLFFFPMLFIATEVSVSAGIATRLVMGERLGAQISAPKNAPQCSQTAGCVKVS